MLAVTCIFASITASYAAEPELPLDHGVMIYIKEQSEKRNISPELVLAVIRVESSFKEKSVSSDRTCFGLMQINKINLKWLRKELGTNDLLDPYQNVEAGIYILAGLVQKYDDFHSALMAYNAGEAGAKRQWNKGYYSSKYSRKVVSYMDEYMESRIFDSLPVIEYKTAGAVTELVDKTNVLRLIKVIVYDAVCDALSNPSEPIQLVA